MYYDLGFKVRRNLIDKTKMIGSVGRNVMHRVAFVEKSIKPDHRGEFLFNRVVRLQLSSESLGKYFNVDRKTMRKYINMIENKRKEALVSTEEINNLLDLLELNSKKYNIKPSVILKRMIDNKIIHRKDHQEHL